MLTLGTRILVGIPGMVAIFIDDIHSAIPILLDVLGGLVFLVGGIIWAIALKGDRSCKAHARMENICSMATLHHGCHQQDNPVALSNCSVADCEGLNTTSAAMVPLRVCHRFFAIEAFHFVGFVIFVVLVALGLLQMQRKGDKLMGSQRTRR